MKKKLLLIVLVLALAMFGWACGKDDVEEPADDNQVGATDGEEAPPTINDLYEFYEGIDLADYVTLGEYKGLEITDVKAEPVTDEDVQAQMENLCTAMGNPLRPVQEGDTVNINYIGTIDDVPFDGGSGTTDLTIGSGQFIPGFEEGLIGASYGKSVTLNLTFPDPYEVNPDMSGAETVFTVVIKAIAPGEPVELTDELVAANTEYKTVDEYAVYVRERLVESSEDSAVTAMKTEAWTLAVENADVKKLPQEAVDIYEANVRGSYEYYAALSGITYEQFVENYTDITLEEFNAEILTYAEAMATEDLVFFAILDAENITISEEDYEAGKIAFMESNFGYSKETEFATATGKTLEEYVGKKVLENELLRGEVQDFVLENAVVK